MSAATLDHFHPSSEELLRLVLQHVNRSMLREIAEADYGEDVDAHLQALEAIHAGHVPAPMQWEPKEVLELIRWSEPEDPGWKPGSTGKRGHWMRLFACTVLIRAAAEPANDGYFTGEDSTIIQLIDSAIQLGSDTSLAALKFLCWRMQYRKLDDWEQSDFAVAILLLAVSLGKCSPQLVQFLISEAESDGVVVSELFDQCQKSQKWNDLIRRILISSPAASEDVQRFGRALIGLG